LEVIRLKDGAALPFGVANKCLCAGLTGAFTSGSSVPPVSVPVAEPPASPRPRGRLSPPEPGLSETVTPSEKGFRYYCTLLSADPRLF